MLNGLVNFRILYLAQKKLKLLETIMMLNFIRFSFVYKSQIIWIIFESVLAKKKKQKE